MWAGPAATWKETGKEGDTCSVLSPKDSLSLRVLTAIHAAPPTTWPVFVVAATTQAWTVEATRAAVTHLKATLAARPGVFCVDSAGFCVGVPPAKLPRGSTSGPILRIVRILRGHFVGGTPTCHSAAMRNPVPDRRPREAPATAHWRLVAAAS